MRRRAAALMVSAFIGLSAILLPAPAGAAVDGVDVDITKIPERFEAGKDPQLVEVVVSTDNGGRCQKVRWSMVVSVEGAKLDQVKVTRVEDDGSFPTQVRGEGDGARFTDLKLDPGALCRGRTVTARYQVSVAGDAREGKVTFAAQAFDTRAKLLQEASATAAIEGGKAAPSASPTPTESPSEEPSEEPSDESSEEPAAVPPPVDADRASGLQQGTPSLLGPGLIVGAVLVFIGVGLLLRLRMKNRAKRHPVASFARY